MNTLYDTLYDTLYECMIHGMIEWEKGKERSACRNG